MKRAIQHTSSAAVLATSAELSRRGNCLIALAALLSLVMDSPAQGPRKVIPKDQKPVLHVFPPSAAEQSKPGIGKFVIFTREPVGREWDFIAGAWECIPSSPETPFTKRVEFCHSSWNCAPLLNTLVADDSNGMHPRFARLQVDTGTGGYAVNLYGKFRQEIPFIPLATDGGSWLVRKPGETEGCWSYSPKQRQYLAHFVDPPPAVFSWSKLSPDGKSRAWVLASMPRGWQGGMLRGRLILQRDGKKADVSVPIELEAFPGSGVPVIPKGIQLTFSAEGEVQFRAWRGDNEAEDRVWNINIATGKLNAGVAPHSQPAQDPEVLDGVPVPEYLRSDVRGLEHFGRSGLAPAFLLHLGILKERPEYPDCTAGVSRDGRHVLYRAGKGPLARFFIYGDLLTRQTVRWESPDGLDNSLEFVWVETPD
ncbi:MAG TPA: hypothetical protein VMV10_01630 [Pirellulales bacterium]|nr:hypothetical protein [Pirellulales bacterium]